MTYNKSIILGNLNNDILQKKTLVQLFSNTVKNYPNKIALHFNGSSITYKELDSKSNAFAHHLINFNIGKDSIIGLFLPRGIELFIAHLGILKAGATYIPFDSETPIERVKTILNDAKSYYCITNFYINEKIHCISVLDSLLINNNTIDLSEVNNTSHIIFTSGSTGKPKGIPICHYQISHLIESENLILKINYSDVVYQGFSISFDMWFEEVWISFLVGATLIVADSFIAKSFDILEDFLNSNKVTVLHAVPSLLNYIGNNINSIRIVNSGGEACVENVIKKWAINNIILFNSYGPTETTVTATIGVLKKDDLLNVGHPLPNYSIAFVDENNFPVNKGEIGELIISGIGVSNGYFINSELTTLSFISKPSSLISMYGDIIYLTGDTGFINDDGNVVIIGRKDNQIKIRGYRVELAEIESKINRYSGIINSVVIKDQTTGIDQLIAYYETNGDDDLDLNLLLKQYLQNLLPSYMIPSQFVKVDLFNRLPSGKIDRKNLPTIQVKKNNYKIDKSFDSDSITQLILNVLVEIFPNQELNVNSDFFDDLGGHSMLAAIFVSTSREKTGIDKLSIFDVYKVRKIGEIISLWKNKNEMNSTSQFVIKKNNISKLHFYTCSLFQCIALLFIFGLFACQLFVPYLSYYVAANEIDGLFIPIICSVISFLITPPIIILLILLIKKILIGRFEEGDFPLWGFVYFKWWFFKRLLSIISSDILSNTPLYNYYLRSIGFEVSNDAQLNKFEFGISDLIKIGNNVTISSNVVLNNAFVENGIFKLRTIILEDNSYIGTSSIVNGNCVLKQFGTLKDLSSLESNKVIHEFEIWEGSPAKYLTKDKDQFSVNFIQPSTNYKLLFILLIFLLPVIIIIPLLPTIVGLHYLDENSGWYNFSYLYTTPIFSLIYILLFIFEIVFLTKMVNRNIKEGTYSIFSHVYIKKWFCDQLFSLLLIVIKPIFATVFISKIYRMLGAKVGRNTEISNASNVSHNLLEIGKESFIADVAIIGENDIKNKQLILKKTIIGNKIFIGNSGVIPQGLNLGNNKLIGVLSTTPSQFQLDKFETDWFGSPSFQLPKRQIISSYSDRLTFNPSLSRKFLRAIIEFIRVLIPQSLILCFSIIFIAFGHDLITKNSFYISIFYFPIYYLLIVALPSFFTIFLFKWIFIGTYKKAEHPMWTINVWLTEAITSLYESIAVTYFLEFLKGTTFLPIFMRFLGVKIGKKVFLDTTDFTEFDLVSIGDFSALNYNSGPQTHLFEDRIMKMDKVNIGSNVTIGSGSIILYDTIVGSNTIIEPLSLVMKGEKVPPNSIWNGIPIKIKNV
jgi:non-ribosomal peptide synthetase-like protein